MQAAEERHLDYKLSFLNESSRSDAHQVLQVPLITHAVVLVVVLVRV
jgi:hypothetical protein